jgi:hypothetical protein
MGEGTKILPDEGFLIILSLHIITALLRYRTLSHVVVLPPDILVATVVIRYLIECFRFPHPLVSICLHLPAYLLASQYSPQARLRMGFTKVWFVHNNII